MHNVFLCMFTSILYMFWCTMFFFVCLLLFSTSFGAQCFSLYVYFYSLHVSDNYMPIIRRKQLFQCDTWYLLLCVGDRLVYQRFTHVEWQVPGIALIQLFSPDNGHIVARNMYRVEIHIERKNVHQLVSFARLCKDAARSTKHKIHGLFTCLTLL
jgi:hypothetical protein